ncbi:uncharacterized protein LOC128389231 [Panonychus citri]|uniref:uncharacterized protein LOC128389231 n=1 Tax=Panonychus citri TaxID=50023 RepID=UPI002307849C|nr:uncharacterized protein LOC128389231 [Panonychus citri]
MSINCLPPECLLVIFNFLDQLDDLRHCASVCSKWKLLILDRCSKVEYLLENPFTDSPDNIVYIGPSPKLENLELAQLFPRLKILDTSYTGLANWENATKRVKSIKGLINHTLDKNQSPIYFLNDLEMVSTELVDFFVVNQHITRQLKQVFIQNVNLVKMNGVTSKFYNLRRLHIVDKFPIYDCDFPLYDLLFSGFQKLYKGSKLHKLKILEFDFESMAGVLVYPGFCFIDFCPNLESAFFHVESTYCQFNTAIKINCLRDLVIEYQNDNPREWSPFFRSGGNAQKWETLKCVLSKFPNLKHLALRNNLKIRDEDIEELLELLPNLVLLDERIN